MLDIRYIKEKPEEVVARLAKKGKDAKEANRAAHGRRLQRGKAVGRKKP